MIKKEKPTRVSPFFCPEGPLSPFRRLRHRLSTLGGFTTPLSRRDYTMIAPDAVGGVEEVGGIFVPQGPRTPYGAINVGYLRHPFVPTQSGVRRRWEEEKSRRDCTMIAPDIVGGMRHAP